MNVLSYVSRKFHAVITRQSHYCWLCGLSRGALIKSVSTLSPFSYNIETSNPKKQEKESFKKRIKLDVGGDRSPAAACNVWGSPFWSYKGRTSVYLLGFDWLCSSLHAQARKHQWPHTLYIIKDCTVVNVILEILSDLLTFILCFSVFIIH